MMAEPVRSASFSRCRQYRYSLRRDWDEGVGTCVFIGLNPSLASHQKDDPTIRRCMGFCRSWGYRSLLVVNLFALRTPYPAELKRSAQPIGNGNRLAVRKACHAANLIVAAWGVHGSHLQQDQKMAGAWRDRTLYCFARTRDGHPVHPLYQRRDAILQIF